jgi:hypothetical protein
MQKKFFLYECDLPFCNNPNDASNSLFSFHELSFNEVRDIIINFKNCSSRDDYYG